MITKLKRGYTFELQEDGNVSVNYGTGIVSDNVFLDKVGQYSLLCFLIRVLRHKKGKK